ncbi:MAG TPA: hypothetical protein DEP87_00300 [Candidatus Pacebacteria bacterium]|nr:hypothetical protein [Candidatus Paceibacterota bacterium]
MLSPQVTRVWSPYEKTELARVGLSHLVTEVTTEIPVEYLTGSVDFRSWRVKVTPEVLIPRIETEALVSLVLKDLNQFRLKLDQSNSTSTPITLVEVGTGSGAIGLSLWRELVLSGQYQKIQLNLLDVSAAALQVAAQNLVALQHQSQVLKLAPPPVFEQRNLLTNWSPLTPINLLIANLPYIPAARISKLDASVRDFEPLLALNGGKDGLRLIEKLLCQSQNLLAPNGIIWLEIDETHSMADFEKFKLPFNYQFFNDCFDRPRFVRGAKC